MAMSLNKVQLIGNLTRDPEMKQIPGGQVVTSFGIATNLTWKDQSGERKTKVEYHNIVAWRRLAEICGEYLRKGSKVYIEGRLQTRDWEGEDGKKRYRTEIVADNMIMLDRKGDAQAVPIEREAGGVKEESVKSADSTDKNADDLQDMGEPVGETKGDDKGDVSIDDLPF
jgi:single-strand DNA-binding protein